MLRAYLAGARAAAQRWPLVAVLGLITALFGLAFALASGAWLGEALEGSLATRMLLHRIDPDVLVDLWYHHREGWYVLLIVALVLAIVHTVLWWWLHGVVICALQLPPAERALVWTRGLELAPVMARLFCLALVVLALFSGAVGGAAYTLLRWTRSSPQALIWYQIGGAAAVLWVLGCVFLVAVHDHARLRAARSGEGAVPAYRWALGFVVHGGERAFALACALQLTGLAVWLAYQAVGVSFPMTAILGLTVTLLWGEAFLWLRMWLRVWFFAAQNELQT
jgi:hypothetical protein